jgi:di/tricarboxylate transporter
MIGLPAFQVVPILYTSILAAFLLVWTRILDSKEVLPAIEWSVLITIGASIGLGRALSGSGASQSISEVIVSLSAFAGPMGTLLLLYVLTNMLTEMITNAAAAALSFPLALSCAATLGVSSTPFIIAIAIAASASFATPIGYQTNMLVYGPGGYRFKDFIKIGLPINVMYAIGSMLIIPWVWPF